MMRRSAKAAWLVAAILIAVGCEETEVGVEINKPVVVTDISPAAGSVDVPLDANVLVTFSEDIDRATLTAGSFYLEGPAGVVAAAISYDRASFTATLDPDADLGHSWDCTVTLTTGVRAVDGSQPLNQKVTSAFRTIDPPPLRVLTVLPSPGSEGASLTANAVVTFSEGVDTTSVTPTSFSLWNVEVPASPVQVPGAFSFSSTDPGDPLTTNDIVTLDPTGPLDYSALHEVRLTTGIKSTRGTATGGSLEADVAFGFRAEDPPPLEIASTDPAAGTERVSPDVVITVVFSEDVDPTTVDVTSFYVEDVTDPGNPIAVAGILLAAADTVTFDPDPDLGLGHRYQVTMTTTLASLRATARGGQLAEDVSFSFTVEVAPPLEVVSTVPAGDETGVDVTAAVSVTFSADVFESTLDGTTFYLWDETAGANVAGTITYDPGAWTATFTPAADLAAGTDHTVHVTTGVVGKDGGRLEVDFSSAFRTAESSLINSTSPADAETGVSVAADIVVTFSEPMAPATITTASFKTEFVDLWGRTQALPGTITADGTDEVFTFTPDPALWNGLDEPRKLLYGTTYTVTLADTITNAAGTNSLTGGFVFSFTTGAAPQVVVTDPADGTTDVPIAASLTATFDRPMDSATVDSPVTTFTLELADSTPVPGAASLSGDGLVATFDPDADLAFATGYRATLMGGPGDIADTEGNYLDADVAFGFTTAEANVVTVAPPDEAGEVSTNHMVALVFTRPVDVNSVDSDSFHVSTGGVKAAGLRSLSDDGLKLIFVPYPEYLGTTAYAVTATTAITDTDGNPLQAEFTSTFTTSAGTDNADPAVPSPSPGDGTTGVSSETDIRMTFGEHMNPASINVLSILVWDGSDPVTGTVGYDIATKTAIFTPDAPLTGGNLVSVTVTTDVTDLARNGMGADYSFGFTIEVVAPAVATSSPTGSDVSGGANIVVTFNENMDPASFDAASFRVNDGTSDIAGTITVAGDTATFDPSDYLVSGTAYTVTVSALVTDAGGTPLGADHIWLFTIETTPPSVTKVDPPDVVASPTVDTVVTVTFDEPVDPSSPTVDTVSSTGNVRLLKNGTDKVYGLVTVSSDTLVFDPAEDLELGTSYTFVLTAGGVSDLAGNALAAEESRVFTTLPLPGAFSLLTPTNAATGVSTEPTLDWEDSADVATYTILVDDDPAFGSPDVSDSTLVVSQYTVGASVLGAGTMYYWRVTAVNASGQTPATNNDFSFTTQ